MPGRHLNSREQRLGTFWREPPASFPQPLLKGIALQGPPSLRGIRNIHVPFDYPITAVCGKNGAGKSTVLGLAAFSASRPSNWSVSPRRVPSVRRALRRMTFAWDEFFFRRAGDPPLSGLLVQFDYTYGGNDIQVSRVRTDKGRWANAPDPGRSRRPRLPERPIDFVSLARIIPPGELRTLRRRPADASGARVISLSDLSVQAMSSIFDQPYESIELRTKQGMPLAHCSGTAHYTGFDMGSGENSAVAIFAALENLPVGGLLLVEEIEHGFHPLAQERLLDVLTRIVLRRKQQIIFTTHSEYIIDALPQAGRVLLNRHSAGHQVVTAPTTRQFMFTMTGEPKPELTIYVEDTFARRVVEQALCGAHRRRVKVIPIGSAEQVVGQLGTHLSAGLEGPAICVLDGDCSDSNVEKWMRNAGLADNPEFCLKLPLEGLSPEQWVVEAVREEPYLSDLTRQVKLDAVEVQTILSDMVSLADSHDVPWQFATRSSVPPESATYILASCAGTHPALQDIRDSVASQLEGERNNIDNADAA